MDIVTQSNSKLEEDILVIYLNLNAIAVARQEALRTGTKPEDLQLIINIPRYTIFNMPVVIKVKDIEEA